MLLLSPGIAVFLYGMSEAGDHGGFGSPRSIIAVLAGVTLIALFFWHATIQGKDALIDVSLLRRRGFASAAAVNFLLGIALFGSLILIPLYYQLVRHNSPLQIGLLLGPQGIGAALSLPFAGWLTDKVGARNVVTAGLAMAAAFQALSRAETPRATSALNAIQRIAGAIGTALFAIILQHAITSNLARHHGGTTAIAALSQHAGVATTAALADTFGTTFWVAAALIGTALVPALLLPSHRRNQANAGQAPEQRPPHDAVWAHANPDQRWH